MMEGTNREWLNKMSLYDMLMMMQRGIERANCNEIAVCVMNALHDTQWYDRCTRHNGKCENCIAGWLGEKRG